MSTNILAFLLIFLAIGARVLFSYLLQSQKKALQSQIVELSTVRVKLKHEQERHKAAEELLAFYKRQLDDLPHQISEAREDLERLEKKEEEKKEVVEEEEEKSEEEKKEDRHEIKVAGRGREREG